MTLPEILAMQSRAFHQDGPGWLDEALSMGHPDIGPEHPKALLKNMMQVGDEFAAWENVYWWAEAPEWHLNRVGTTLLLALGRSEGIKLEGLPDGAGYDYYAKSARLTLNWLNERAQSLCAHHDTVTAEQSASAPEALAGERWGLPQSCKTLGEVFEINVLLAAGPSEGALARLRIQAVHSPGARLVLAAVPASACLLVDADFGQMLSDLSSWLQRTLTSPADHPPWQDIALAWDLTPAIGEAIPLAAILGDSAGAAFACAALQALVSYTPVGLRADLLQSRYAMSRQFMSAAINAQGMLRPVGWVNAKSQAIRPLVTWSTQNHNAGEPAQALYLAEGQTGLDDLPTVFCPTPLASVTALVQHIAQGAEHLSTDQRVFLEAWYAPPAQARMEVVDKSDSDTTGNETRKASETSRPEVPEQLLNRLVDLATDNPVSTLRQAAIQGVARWQRYAGGRLQHQFVPLAISPESGSRFGLKEQADPFEQLQELLAAHDTGAHKAYLLTGLPGAGKTVLLRRHMLDLCSRLLADNTPPASANKRLEIPIYIALNRFPSNKPPTPPSDPASALWWADQARAHVLRQLEELGWQAPMLAAFRNTRGADTPQWCWRWHLDGLNELPMPPDDPDQDRGERARWVVQGFLDAFKPVLKPLLTVRSTHFDDYSWLTIDVLPWEPRHIQTYLRKYFTSKPKIALELWNALAQDASLLDLCRRPMHLHMQCELAEAGFSPLAADRASIYLAHVWLRLRRGLGQFGGKTADDRLSGNDLLTAQDRKDILNTRPGQISANDLRRLPIQGLLLRGLIDQAESQYWRDAECGRQQQERCKVAVEVDDLILKDSTGKPVDEDLKKRWLHACVALGFVEINARETTMAFSHQSWGEFFAALRLLDTPPDELTAQVEAGIPGAQQKWERAMVRPFIHLNIPVSAEAERQALRERLNQCWAAALPLLQDLLRENNGRLTVSMDTFKTDRGMHQASEDAVIQYFNALGYVRVCILDFDTARGLVHANLDAWASGTLSELGLPIGKPWKNEPSAWQILLTKRLFSCFENQVWEYLRERSKRDSGFGEDTLQQLREEPGHMALPAPSDIQEVFNLALQSLPEAQTKAWLRAWMARPPHPHAWRVLAPAALALRPRLEPPESTEHSKPPHNPVITPCSGMVGLGMWQAPQPLLQHLRRWLLLASINAGPSAQPPAHAAGLLAALAAPITGLDSVIAATWQRQLASAFKGCGLDVLLRIQAGLLLGELGDNIRYERCTVSVKENDHNKTRTGIRLRTAHWAKIPASGQGIIHRIGAAYFTDTRPVWQVPDRALPNTRFAHTPVVVMQWLAYVDDLCSGGASPPELRALRLARWSNPLQPITTVTWFEAQAFTAWAAPLHAGLFPEEGGLVLGLPTEVQHEAAVRYSVKNCRPGGQARWPHDPKGRDIRRDMPAELFNHNRTRWGAPSPVGVFSSACTPTGIEVMGNVWTWCSNVYTPNYEGANQAAVLDALRPEEVQQRLARQEPSLMALRGGSFSNTPDYARAASRFLYQPTLHYLDIGMRWQLSSPIIEA